MLPDDEERQLLGALVAISTGVEVVANLNVPAEVGRRLLQCYDDLGKLKSRFVEPIGDELQLGPVMRPT